MSIQTFILNLFPKYCKLQDDMRNLRASVVDSERETSRLRVDYQNLVRNLNSSRCEIFDLRRELQAEKLRNELPRLFLTKNQILKLMANSNLDPEIHRELEQTYEKLVQLQVRKERQSNFEA